jgi:hypothetical protein
MTGGLWVGVWIGLAVGSAIFLIGGMFALHDFRRRRTIRENPKHDPRDFPDERCPACQGTGAIPDKTGIGGQKCLWCDGSGWDPTK